MGSILIARRAGMQQAASAPALHRVYNGCMGARVRWAIVVSVVLCNPAWAQVAFKSAAPPPPVVFSRSPQPPPEQPPPEQPPAGQDLFRARPDTYAPRHDRSPRRSRVRHRFLHGYAYYPYASYAYTSPLAYDEYQTQRQVEVQPVGVLQLEVQPASAQVYVDGYFVGTVVEFGGALDAGVHRVEILEPGFETLVFDVRIFPNETTRYGRDLRRIAGAPKRNAPIAARPAPKTLYVIPRCYAGDTPPVASQLPAGCDASHVRTVRGS